MRQAARGAAVVLATAAPSLAGVTRAWTGASTSGNRWDYAQNWSPAGQPQDGDQATIEQAGAAATSVSYYNTSYPSAKLSSLKLDGTGSGGVTLDLSQSHALSAATESIGYRAGGVGSITQSGGANSADTLVLGDASGSAGNYTLTGGALSAGTGGESIGNAGTGTFTQTGGSNSVNGTLRIAGSPGGTGQYNLQQGSLTANTVQLNAGGSFTQTETIQSKGGFDLARTGGMQNDQYTFKPTVSGDIVLENECHGGFTCPYPPAPAIKGFFTAIQPGYHGTVTFLNCGGGNILRAGGGIHTDVFWTAADPTSTDITVQWIDCAAWNVQGEPFLWENGSAKRLYFKNCIINNPDSINYAEIGVKDGCTIDEIVVDGGNPFDLHFTMSGAYTGRVNRIYLNNHNCVISGNPSANFANMHTQIIYGLPADLMGTMLNATIYNQTGGTVNGVLQNQGTFNYTSGTFNGRLENYGAVNLNADFTAGDGIDNRAGATITISTGRRVTLNGTGLLDDGTISLTGGTFTASNQVICNRQGNPAVSAFNHTAGTNNAGSLYVGFVGSGSYTLSNSATLNVTAGTMVGFRGAGTFTQTGGVHSIVNNNAAQLDLGDSIYGNGTYNLSGGVLTADQELIGNSGTGIFTQTGGTNTARVLLTIAAQSGGHGTYNLNAGQLAASTIVNNDTFTQAAGATLVVTGAFTNSGTATFSGPQQWTSGAAFNATGGTSTFNTDAGGTSKAKVCAVTTSDAAHVTFAVSQHLQSLTMLDNSQASIPDAAGTQVISVNQLTFGASSPWTGSLDLNSNALIARTATVGLWSGSGYGGMSGLLASAWAAGHWTGPGIRSTTASLDPKLNHGLGILTAQQAHDNGNSTILNAGAFHGETVSPTDVLVQYGWNGDVNMDGTVDYRDYGVIDSAALYNAAHPATPRRGYSNGDLNLDGVINYLDYGLIDNAYLTLSAPHAGSASAGAAVPEPASAAMLLALAPLLARRRR